MNVRAYQFLLGSGICSLDLFEFLRQLEFLCRRVGVERFDELKTQAQFRQNTVKLPSHIQHYFNGLLPNLPVPTTSKMCVES